MADRELTLQRIPGTYAVCRFAPFVALPEWTSHQDHRIEKPFLHCVMRTDQETSVIIEESRVPSLAGNDNIKIEAGFVAFRVVGVLAFSEVGILARLSSALAHARVPVLAVSTFDTDILLVPAGHEHSAKSALRTVAQFSD